jgi:dynein heavy chain
MIQDFCRSEGFTGTAVKMIEDLEYLDKSLTDYLDKKRMQFARLYFTSNDELIGLMGNITNQAYVQVFLSKLFEGIAGLIFGEHQIVGFYSKSKEQLFFKSPISTLVPPELWLKEIEIGMKKTIYQQLHKGLKDYVARQRGEANESKRQLLDEGQAENSDTKMDQCDAMTRMEQEGRMS